MVSQAATLAIVFYSGETMNALLIVLPPLIQVLAVAGGIHLINYYFEALPNRRPRGRTGQMLTARLATLCSLFGNDGRRPRIVDGQRSHANSSVWSVRSSGSPDLTRLAAGRDSRVSHLLADPAQERSRCDRRHFAVPAGVWLWLSRCHCPALRHHCDDKSRPDAGHRMGGGKGPQFGTRSKRFFPRRVAFFRTTVAGGYRSGRLCQSKSSSNVTRPANYRCVDRMSLLWEIEQRLKAIDAIGSTTVGPHVSSAARSARLLCRTRPTGRIWIVP